MKEGKQINRPFVYLAGGLVLGETIALGMTGMHLIGPAALISAFLCASAWTAAQKHGKAEGWTPALLVALLGLWAGVFRMEWEQACFRREETWILECSEEERTVLGKILDVEETAYGSRLLLGNCEIQDAGSEKNVRRLYVYTKSGPELKIGRKVRVGGALNLPDRARNPGGFDYRLYCRSAGISGILTGKTCVITDYRYLVAKEAVRTLRQTLSGKIDSIADAEDAGVLKAVLLGGKNRMDSGLYELYRKNGISHLLAISGLHMSVIGMGLWKFLRKLGAGYPAAGLTAFLVLMIYGALAGFGPSVIRSAFMMGLAFLAEACGRTYDRPSAMCVPFCGILLWRPYLLLQASFQLSFLAVGAVLFPGQYFLRQKKAGKTAEALWISFSIQLMTAPVILMTAYELPVYGTFLNLLVIPLMTLVLVSGILGMAGAFISIPFGRALLGGAHGILMLYEALCRWAQALPGASAVFGAPSFLAAVIFYVCVLSGAWLAVHRGKGWLVLWLCGALFLLPIHESGLSAAFLDVGQGDGIVISSGNRAILVDCGSSQIKDPGGECLVPFLKSRGIRRLEAAAVTHGDLDHMNGVRYLLSNPECGISLGKLILPEALKDDPASVGLAAEAAERKIPVFYLSAGESPGALLGEKTEILCLSPAEAGNYSDRNEGSLVLFIRYGGFSMMLTGDAGAESEKAMKEAGVLTPVTVLKAGHHGSASATGQEFLEAVRPDCVIFSYGEGNSYGHPSDEVTERCEIMGAVRFDTAHSGAILLHTEGRHLEISGWLDRRSGI